MPPPPEELAICVTNDGYAASLERRKLYVTLPDHEASRRGLLRVIDESGEDYLYPADFFMTVHLPRPLRRRLLDIA